MIKFNNKKYKMKCIKLEKNKKNKPCLTCGKLLPTYRSKFCSAVCRENYFYDDPVRHENWLEQKRIRRKIMYSNEEVRKRRNEREAKRRRDARVILRAVKEMGLVEEILNEN
jgi:hypothetical protein